MKITKILALGLLAVTMTACSDDDNFNTNDVTVTMGEAELTLPEDQLSSATYYYIPIVLSGETNGPVEVTVRTEAYGENGAEPGKNVIVTSETIKIPAGETTGSIQLYPKGDTEENPDRQFTITIVSAKGATVGTQATTLITLLDNEAMVKNAVQSLLGQWTLSAQSNWDGDVAYPVTIIHPEGADDATVQIVGFLENPNFALTGQVACDATNGATTINYDMTEAVGESSRGPVCGFIVEDGNLYYGEPEVITVNSDFTEAECTGISMYWGVLAGGQVYGYDWYLDGFKMAK